jgi:hypothetical protein
MKNVTLSADEDLIAAARKRARTEDTTLNEVFRRWLASDARPDDVLQRYEAAMADISGHLRVGHKLTRAQMNER